VKNGDRKGKLVGEEIFGQVIRGQNEVKQNAELGGTCRKEREEKASIDSI
jgi:hypothetical protein